MPEISTVVDVQIQVKDRGLSRQGFGNMAILFESDDVAWRTQLVTQPSEIKALHASAFGEFSPLYIEGSAVFDQDPGVPQVLLIRKGADDSIAAALAAADAANSDWYCIVSTVRTLALIKEIAAYVESRTKPAIYIAQTADADCLLGGASVIKDLYDLARARTSAHYHNPAKGKYRLTISSAFVAGNSANLKVNGIALGAVPFNVTSDGTMIDLATALQATSAVGTATVTMVAGAADNDRVIEIEAANNKTDVLITEYVCSGGASINTATFEKLSGGAESLAGALASSRISQDAGSTTWKFGTLSGITADSLTATEQANLELYNANHYLTYGGVSLPAQGKLSTGRFIDVQQGADWISVNMTADIFDLLQSAAPKKIPYTDKGLEQIAGTVRSRLRLAVDAGILAEDPAPAVTVPKTSTQAAVDKAARVVKGISFTGTLAGAVHKVVLTGQVTL